MESFEGIVISCANWEELPGAYNKIIAALPPEIRKRMNDIMVSYLVRFGPQGVFERMNNRKISQILAEFRPDSKKTIASGQIDGLRYDLYEKPMFKSESEKQ